MDLSPTTPDAIAWSKLLYGQDTREIAGDQEVKVQFTGPGSEVILQEGPPAGKKWTVYTQVQIKESDV